MKFNVVRRLGVLSVSLICASALAFSGPLSAYAGKSSDESSNKTQGIQIEASKNPAPQVDESYEIVSPTPLKGVVYNGLAQNLVNAGSGKYGSLQGKMVYSTEMNGTYAETLPQAKEAGNYIVWYKCRFLKGNEWVETDPQSVTASIATRPASITPAFPDEPDPFFPMAESNDSSDTVAASGDDVTFEGGVDGHSVKSVDLTFVTDEDGNTYETIPSNAVIVDESGKDVTANYSLSYYSLQVMPYDSNDTDKNLTLEVKNELSGASFSFSNFNKSFVKMHLTRDEIQALEAGTKIKVTLAISENLYPYATLSEEALQQVFEEYASENNAVVQSIFSIKMTKQVEGQAEEVISKWDKSLDATVSFDQTYPSNMVLYALGGSRVSQMGLISNSVGSYLFDAPGYFGLLQAEKTSYTVEKGEAQKANGASAGANNNAKKQIKSSDADKSKKSYASSSTPKTGDQVLSILIPVIIVLLVLAAIVATIVILRNRKNSKQ